MASMMTVNLNRGDAPNLGFRLQGGVDFAQPLLIQKVNNGSPADRAGLLAGDSVIKINNTDVFNLRHKDAQDVIIRAGPAFAITIQRGGSTWRPSVTPTGALNQGSINNISPVTKTSLAAQPQQSIDAIGTGHNTSAKPFLNGTSNGGPKLVNKQYNSPIGLYSDQSIAESITAQSEILSTGAVGVNFKKNEKNYDASKSAVFSMLQEAEREPRESEAVNRSDFYSRQSRHPMPNANRQNYYQNNYQYEPEITRCTDCERVIVGVFVRIKDKNLHVECFKCSTCGASLKNVGYYNINNKLYCDIHAKLAAKSNAPGPNLVPVTIPPGGKAPASAISAALSSHSLPSPGPVSPKLGGPISPSQNLTAAPFQQNYTTAPRPFSSVAAPLSPNNYSRPLPKTPTQAPPQPTFAPPQQTYAPPPAPVTPEKVEVVENVVWPPYQEDLNTLPTASPLYFPPSTHVHVKVRHLSPNHQKARPRPQTPYEKSKSLVAACEFSTEDHQEEQFQSDCVTSQTESESDYQDLEDYSNFLRSMEPKMSLTSAEVYNINGRRSTIECAQALADHLQTAMLVDSVMKSQRPRSPPPLSADAPSAVKKPPPPKPKMESPITPVCPLKCQQSCCNECPECPMNKPAELRRLSELERFEEMRAKIQNNVAQGWESQMVSALRTTPDVPFCASPDLSQLPTRSPRGPMASAMTIAPPKPFQPIQSVVPVFNTKPVPLPEETVPYLPPERPLIPELQKPKPQERREEEPRGSPFVEALKTAPQRPFSPIVGTGQPPTPIRPKKKSDPFLKDLPKPQEKLTMLAALTTASDRTYSPMTVDYTGGEMRVMTYEQKREEEEAKELKELEEKRRFSIKQPIPQPFIGRMVETFEGGNPGQKTPDANFPPVSVELQGASEYHADYQEVKSELSSQITQQQDRALQMQREVQQMQAQVQSSQKVYEQHQTYEAQQTYQSQQESHEGHVCCIHQKECQLAKKREIAKQNEEVILKKPLTLAQSLHKQDQIPSYQSALQFEEQIQLPHHKDIKQLLKPEERSKIVPNPRPLLRADPHHNMATPPPKIIAPVSVVTPGEHSPNPRASFQTVNDNFQPPSSAISQRLGQSTPSKMNKTPSAIPYYQQNLVATQFLAPEINVFDPSSPAMSRSPSPCPGAKPERDRPNSPFRKPPSRPKSPAAGPPPNPLKKHQDPAGLIKDVQVEKAKDKVTSYIPHHQEKYQTIQTREGDYYDQSRVVDYSQNRSQINEPNFQQQTQQARAYEADATQKHHVHFEGNAKVSTKEQSASERKQELNKTQAQSTQVSADGRTKVQRKKTVVEEFEQSHKEKSIEIQKTYPFERVNAPIPIHEEQGMQGLHVTNPKQIHSPFLGQPIQGPPPMPKNPIPVAPKIPEPPPPPTYKPVKAPVPSKVPVKPVPPLSSDVLPSGGGSANPVPDPIGTGGGRQAGGNVFAPKRGRGVLNVGGLGARVATCGACHSQIRGPFITALGKIWCPEHFTCATASCRRPLQDIGFVEDGGQLHCEYCFEQYLAPNCAKCGSKIKGDCLKAIQKNFHPECFNCAHCGKLFGNSPFFLEDGLPYCETDWNEMFTTKCFACGFPVEAGDRWVEALSNNYHSQCFNCTMCKKNLEGQSFYAKGGRPFCKNHAR